MGSESRTCDTGIRVESHPKTVAMGYQDWRLLTGTELTNQGGCLIATIPAKDRVKMSEDSLDVCPLQISRMGSSNKEPKKCTFCGCCREKKQKQKVEHVCMSGETQ